MVDPVGVKKAFVKMLHVAMNDARLYFFKWPNVTFGLLLPVIIYLAFLSGQPDLSHSVVPGLVAMASLFGAGAIESVSLPLERAKGTLERLMAAPISLGGIIMGKIFSGAFFGMVIGAAYSVLVVLLAGQVVPHPVLLATGLAFSSFSFAAMGACISAPFRDIPEAMPPATIVRVSMVFVCGTFIPLSSFPPFMQVVAFVLPLTHGILVLEASMTVSGWLPALLPLGMLAVFFLAFTWGAVLLLKRSLP